MAKELRKSRGEELFAVAVREVFDAVAELRTDQSTEWTEELKESLMEFADIIAEPTDLPPEREFDFEINLESDEPPKERTYRMSPAELQELRDRYVGPFVITQQISPVAFRLQLPAGVRVHDVVHASMLEKWYDDPDQPAKSERVPIVHDANRFHVQDILDVAFNNNGTGLLFRVRWAFPYNVPSEDTWEPLRGVKHLDIFRSFLLSKSY
eukprot:jgi/Tetstr1/431689/TSEL_021215.t2